MKNLAKDHPKIGTRGKKFPTVYLNKTRKYTDDGSTTKKVP